MYGHGIAAEVVIGQYTMMMVKIMIKEERLC
jgi:hypothetical protein